MFLSEGLSSWEQVSNSRFGSERPRQFANDLDSNQLAWNQFRHPSGPCDAVEEDEYTISSLIDPRWRHAHRRFPEQGNLPGKSCRVCALATRRENTQLGGIDLTKLAHFEILSKMEEVVELNSLSRSRIHRRSIRSTTCSDGWRGQEAWRMAPTHAMVPHLSRRLISVQLQQLSSRYGHWQHFIRERGR